MSLKEFINKRNFKSSIIKQAGKILKKEGEEAVKKYLDDNYVEGYKKRDFPITAKCNIVASNRKIEDFDISKFSSFIQNYVFNLNKDNFEEFSKIKYNRKSFDELYKKIANEIGLEKPNYENIQGEIAVIRNAINIYNGVLKKVENRNKKIQEKNQSKDPPKLLSAFDDNGFLAERPGINETIYGYQSVRLRHLDVEKDKDIIVQLPDIYQKYNKKSTDKISVKKRLNKYNVDEYGKLISKRRKERINKDDAILCVSNFGDDWIIFDARGLLRQTYRYKLKKKGLCIKDLLNLFTGDPIINPTKTDLKEALSLSFKDGIINNRTLKVKNYKKCPELISELIRDKGKVAMISIDLGQTNPISYRLSKFTANNVAYIENGVISEDDIVKMKKWREKSDKLENLIKEEAIASLSDDEQREVRLYENDIADNTKKKILEKFNIREEDLDFSKMSNNTYFIRDCLKNKNIDESEFTFEKNGKKLDPTDACFAREYKNKLSELTRKKINEKIWEIKKNSKEYHKISIYKKETIRYIVNKLIKQSKEKSECDDIIVNIEKLQIGGNFFGGRGKRDPGWNNFFLPKEENRWFINACHKAFSELAPHKGIIVIESDPAYTSQTCPKCENCDKENRNGEKFKCKKCNYEANADIDVATENLEKIAKNGRRLIKNFDQLGERLPGAEMPGGARKRKPSKSLPKNGRGAGVGSEPELINQSPSQVIA